MGGHHGTSPKNELGDIAKNIIIGEYTKNV